MKIVANEGCDRFTSVENFNSISQAILEFWGFEKLKIEIHTHTHILMLAKNHIPRCFRLF